MKLYRVSGYINGTSVVCYIVAKSEKQAKTTLASHWSVGEHLREVQASVVWNPKDIHIIPWVVV